MTKKIVSVSVDEEIWDALRMVTEAKGAKMSSYINALLKGVLKHEVETMMAESKQAITVSKHSWTQADAETANQLMRLIGAKPRYKVE